MPYLDELRNLTPDQMLYMQQVIQSNGIHRGPPAVPSQIPNYTGGPAALPVYPGSAPNIPVKKLTAKEIEDFKHQEFINKLKSVPDNLMKDVLKAIKNVYGIGPDAWGDF